MLKEWRQECLSSLLVLNLATRYRTPQQYRAYHFFFFFFSSRRRHTRSDRDWSSDVCSSDLDREERDRPSESDAVPLDPRCRVPEAPAELEQQPRFAETGLADHEDRLASPEIGRASCRERV